MLVYSAYWVVCRIQAWVTILVVPTLVMMSHVLDQWFLSLDSRLIHLIGILHTYI